MQVILPRFMEFIDKLNSNIVEFEDIINFQL